MNKNKKIAMAVVATVMAGAMVIPLAACNPEEDLGPKVDLSEYAWNVMKENGDLDYSVYNGRDKVTLNIAIGHNNADTSTAFKSGNAITLADGKSYAGGSMKPAWAQMATDLNIKWEDVYAGKATNANLKDIVNGSGKVSYKETDMFTTDLSVAVQQVAGGTDILNLADYLDYMPNFKAFLNANPIVYLSLLQDGMKTTGENAGEGQALYVAPYFDGNDDIERYCIIRQDWADLILNGNTALATGEKFTDNCAKTTSVTPYMTELGNSTLEVDITLPTPDPDTGNYTQVGKLVKNYANVKTQITTSGTPLQTAYNDIAGAAYNGTTGNIVEIMNAAIAANSNVTGDKLAALFRAYVDACYTKSATNTESYYAANKRSDLFNGYDAAWDVDDLVAMLRCVMTNQNTLLSTENEMVDGKLEEGIKDRTKRKIYGIAPRSGQNDRTPDMVRLACQLYGARGADSRFEYTYIDKDGNLQDARNDEAFYTALENMNKLVKEGLVADYTGYSGFGSASGYVINKDDQSKSVETFMMYDYCQTQTSTGFFGEKSSDNLQISGTAIPDDYNFAPILTPVSKWNVNGDNEITADEYFRFTESWRSTKTSGLALNGRLAYFKDKLIAALQFVDYLYSKDGQIVSTYGPMATYNATSNKYEGGFWNGSEATEAEVTAGNYFTYKGVKYSGTNYKGNTTPKITDTLYDSFRGVGTYAPADSKVHRNFTNYARYLIGSTLPIGVKDQSFEYQLTSKVGQDGTAKVGAALANKTASGYTVVRGMTLEMNDKDWWYTCVPTGLPTPTIYVASLNNPNMNLLKYVSGEAKTSGNKDFLSIFNYIILKGVSGEYTEQEQKVTLTNLGALVTYMQEDAKAQDREEILQKGWDNAKTYWNYLKPANN